MYENLMDTIGFVGQYDPEVAEAMGLELKRQRRNIELIASENIVSPAVMAAMGSVLTNKYAEGYPGKRYYGGCEDVDIVEEIARKRACQLFGAEHANVQPHSGAQANLAVYFALLKPGDTVLGMNLAHGGHLTHGSPVNLSGSYYNFVPYGINDEGFLDYDALMKQALDVKPKLIVAGASAYPRAIDFAKLREIADACGAYLMVDMAHIAGLVAGGQHMNPVPYADVVTTTTHKTLRGPRGGMILCKEELAKVIDKAIFPGTQGGPLMHIIAAKAVCFGEALKPEFKDYAKRIVDNAQEWKIRYVLHTGDIVDDVDMVGQWKNADEAMQIFDEAGMPYGVLGGNHDVYAGAEGYGNYWKYFGEDRFADQETYGGSYQNNLGHYDLLTENGQDLIILYMSWDIYTEEIEWMNQVLQQYSDRKAIIALHRYTNVKEADSLLDYTGKLLQDQVVAQNPNVIAVLNGHYHGASIQTDCFDDNGDGIKERTVYQICTDYQSDPEGGSEYIKFLYFDLKNDKIYLNSYSPYRDDFNYYDTPKLDNYGEGTRAVNIDISELDVDFDTSDKTLTTDRLTVDLQTQRVIASYPQSTGDVEHTWQGLQPETQYGWYARVTNDQYGITTTQVQEFVTEAQPEPVTYTIEATAGVGGSISNPGQTQVVEGQSITYTITCEPGYQVAQVLVDGQAVQLEDNRYTFTDVKANHTIQVEFAKIPVEDKVDLSGLQAAVDQVEGQDLSGYDQEDLQELHQLLEQAYQVLGDTSLTQEDQAMVDELAEALLAALGRLPELPTPQPSQEPSEQPSAQPSQTPDGEDVPQTGDQANLLAFAVVALTACGGLALVTAERKKREQR